MFSAKNGEEPYRAAAGEDQLDLAVFLSVEMGNQLTLKKEWHVVLRLKPNYKSHDFAELSGM